MGETIKILIADDDETFVNTAVKPAFARKKEWQKQVLSDISFDLDSIDSQQEAILKIKNNGQNYDIALVDLRLRESVNDRPHKDEKGGLNVLRYIKENSPPIKVIMCTTDPSPLSVQTAFDAIIKYGAFDYLFKGDDDSFQKQLLLAIRRAWEYIEIEKRAIIESGKILGESPAMKRVKHLITKAAKSDFNVLITGKMGTGKELAAKAIHQNSSRRDKPYVIINSAAIPEALLETEIFGSCEGAYNGAVEKEGALERADNGTLFLDEIGDLALQHQAKLLRVLEGASFPRVGGLGPSRKHREDHTNIKVDVRIVAATNQPLREMIQRGDFREDLYQRLNVIPIIMPPLKERREDIPLLIDHFIKKYSDSEDAFITGISEEAREFLMKQDWPGNVRELENAIKRAIVFAEKQVLDVDDFQKAIDSESQSSQMVNDLPAAIKDKIDEAFCQRFNEWCIEVKKQSRMIKVKEALGILGVVYKEKEEEISPEMCRKKLALEHAKASRALEFLASEGFLTRVGKRGQYRRGEKFNACA